MKEIIQKETNQVAAYTEQTKSYVAASVSENTKKAFQIDLQRFLKWGGTIPCTEEMFTTYISEHAASHKFNTLKRWKNSISQAHAKNGFDNPTKSELVKSLYQGIGRTHGVKPRRVTPAMKNDLIAICSQMEVENNFIDIRDMALLLIGFGAALRRSEIVALNVDDFEWVERGVLVHIRKSKTDQTGEGDKVAIVSAKGRYCPIKALKRWLSVANITNGSVFRAINRHGQIKGRLSSWSVGFIVKKRVEALGLDPAEYAGHSLRAGLATSAAASGIPIFKIRNTTRHKSDRILFDYVRDSDLFTDNASSIL